MLLAAGQETLGAIEMPQSAPSSNADDAPVSACHQHGSSPSRYVSLRVITRERGALVRSGVGMLTTGRRRVAVVVALVAATAGAVVTATLDTGQPHHAEVSATLQHGRAESAGQTQIVTVRTAVQRYVRPDGSPDGIVPPSWYGA